MDVYPKVRTIRPGSVRNRAFYLAGAGILILNKLRHDIRGYRTPRSFPITELERAVRYDLDVLDHWLCSLESYLGKQPVLEGKTILELGPGEDLGIGLLLLGRGAREFSAIDVHDLVRATPPEFYEALLRHGRSPAPPQRIDELLREVELALAKRSSRLRYVCDPAFDLSVFADPPIDYVFSQAAFEHFDDVEGVVVQLSRILPPGAVLVAEVDLQTHTRWIRDADPLNIYRYSDRFYETLKFPGSPNRVQGGEYRRLLQEHGWTDVKLAPILRLEREYLERVRPTLSPRFRKPQSEIGVLRTMICATR